MRYLTFLIIVMIGAVSAGKAQSPGLKPFKQDPSFFKVELNKKSLANKLNEQVARTNKISEIKNGVFSFQSSIGKVYRMNTDGMPCVVVNPNYIDPKSIVLVRSVPYIPNPYR